MGQEDHDAAERYAQRAEELRVISTTMRDLTCKQVLLRIAKDYDCMAAVREGMYMHWMTQQQRKKGK